MGTGVLVDSKLSMIKQCMAAEVKTNQTLGHMCRGIASTDRDVIIPLSGLVRLHLKYCVQFTIQARHGQTDKGPKESHEYDQRAGEPVL